jgi:hypothetical protein
LPTTVPPLDEPEPEPELLLPLLLEPVAVPELLPLLELAAVPELPLPELPLLLELPAEPPLPLPLPAAVASGLPASALPPSKTPPSHAAVQEKRIIKGVNRPRVIMGSSKLDAALCPHAAILITN